MAKIRIAKSDRNPNWVGYRFMCPGCNDYHMPDNSWQFNGDLDKPTLRPSVLMNKGGTNPAVPICHSFVTDGKIQFLSDCTHELAGQTAELEEI